jgi:hypothetical protein
MNLISRRRLSRLEKLVASVVAERKRREPEEAAWRRQAAHEVALMTVQRGRSHHATSQNPQDSTLIRTCANS